MYTNSPAVRTVVDCIRRNVGQLDLRLFEEIDEGDREPRPDHPAAMSMRYPNPTIPSDQFIRSLFLDFLVHDNAYALIVPAANRQLSLYWLPAFRMELMRRVRVRRGAVPLPQPPQRHLQRLHPGPDAALAGREPSRPAARAVACWRRCGRWWRRTRRCSRRTSSSPRRGCRSRCGCSGPSRRPSGRRRRGSRAEEDLRNRLQAVDRTCRRCSRRGWSSATSASSPNDAEALDVAEVAAGRGGAGVRGARPDGRPRRRPREGAGRFYADTLPPYCEQFTKMLNHLLLVRVYADTDLCFEFNLDEKQMGDERMKTLVNASGGRSLTPQRGAGDAEPVRRSTDGDELVTPAERDRSGRRRSRRSG